MEVKETLENCPFCGGKVRFVKTGCSSRGKIGYLFCDGCKERFFDNDKWYAESELYKKWNNRKPLERVIERLEELTKKYMSNSEKAAELGIDYEKHMIYNGAKGNALEETIEIIKQEMM